MLGGACGGHGWSVLGVCVSARTHPHAHEESHLLAGVCGGSETFSGHSTQSSRATFQKVVSNTDSANTEPSVLGGPGIRLPEPGLTCVTKGQPVDGVSEDIL